MNRCVLETIKKELRTIVRDKKSLIMMFATPLLIPIFILFFSFTYNDMLYNTKVKTYYIGVNYTPNDIEKKIMSDNNLKIKEYKDIKKIKSDFENDKISAYIVLKNNKYNIYYSEMSENSAGAGQNIGLFLSSYNNYLASSYLSDINANKDLIYNNINYELKNTNTTKNDLINIIISFGFIFTVMSITLTGIYCATDIIAGEKERGTLETFLTFPIKSHNLILGKHLGIAIACFITSLIGTFLVVTTLSICHNMFEIYKNANFNFTPFSIGVALLIMLSYSLFISGLVVAMASHSKTYKEAQSALTPLSFMVMIPMFFNILNIRVDFLLSFIPILNHSLLINDLFVGKIDILNIIIMFISTIIYIIIIIKYLTRLYKSEKILFTK